MDLKRNPAVLGSLALGSALLLVACESTDKPPLLQTTAPMNRETTAGQTKPGHDIRKLRTTLIGKPMKEVVRILGQPSQVLTIDGKESWNYRDSAYDSITRRVVRNLDISFANRTVEAVNFSY